jgi:plastocyanin
LTVKAGTKVTWANGDDATHEPASGTEASPTTVFDVPLEGKGTTGSFTFDKAGTYAYYCKIHTSMTGEIVVT